MASDRPFVDDVFLSRAGADVVDRPELLGDDADVVAAIWQSPTYDVARLERLIAKFETLSPEVGL